MSQTDILTEPVLEMTCSACSHPLDVSGLPAFTEIACPECHTPQTVPARLGAFLLVELLGKGGMGAVYRGRDTSLDRWVAVKVMLASLGENPEFVQTFRREAQAAAALNHPNVVQIYSFGVAQGQPYMVMELLEGGRLDQMIARGEMLNEAMVLKIGTEVAEGLNAAAAIGLIHGDVKPENILLDNNGIAKVVDFGLAQFKQAKESSAKGIWGTPYYIAPEKVRGQPNDVRSDIYSLGGTLFHALSLKPPFDGETPIDVVKARFAQPAPPLQTLRPDSNPELASIVARMLESDPLRRYPTYVSLLADMRKLLATMKPEPPAAAAMGQMSRRGGKIILTKKKGGSGSTSGNQPVTIRVSAAGLVTAPVAAEPAKPRMKRGLKIALFVTGGVAILALLIGGIVWGVLHHKRVKAERADADKHQGRLTQARVAANDVWTNLVAMASNAASRVDKARPWPPDAEIAASTLIAATNKLTDASLVAEVETNVPVLVQTINQAATGTLYSMLAELRGLTNMVGTNRAVILVTTNAAAAERTLALVTNAPAQASVIEQGLAVEMVKAERAHKELLALKKTIAEKAAEQQAAAEKAQREKDEADKQARAEAEAKRQAEAKAREAQAEQDRILGIRKANSGLVKQNLFKQAQDAVKEAEKDLKTDAGKEAGKQAIARYELLLDLKAFIIAGVTAEVKANPATGYKFGWMSSKDILGADDAKVTVRGGSVPWEQVPPAQMVRFIKHYAGDPGVARRDAARQYLAAAVYVFEADAGSDAARKMAGEFAGEATRASAAIEPQIKTFLPELSGK